MSNEISAKEKRLISARFVLIPLAWGFLGEVVLAVLCAVVGLLLSQWVDFLACGAIGSFVIGAIIGSIVAFFGRALASDNVISRGHMYTAEYRAQHAAQGGSPLKDTKNVFMKMALDKRAVDPKRIIPKYIWFLLVELAIGAALIFVVIKFLPVLQSRVSECISAGQTGFQDKTHKYLIGLICSCIAGSSVSFWMLFWFILTIFVWESRGKCACKKCGRLSYEVHLRKFNQHDKSETTQEIGTYNATVGTVYMNGKKVGDVTEQRIHTREKQHFYHEYDEEIQCYNCGYTRIAHRKIRYKKY